MQTHILRRTPPELTRQIAELALPPDEEFVVTIEHRLPPNTDRLLTEEDIVVVDGIPMLPRRTLRTPFTKDLMARLLAEADV